MEGKETFTAEEVEQAKETALNGYKSAQEAGVQKLIAEKKLADQVIGAVGKVARDASSLLTINDENPAVAKRILDEYYDGMTIEEYRESIGYKEDQSIINEKLIEKKAKSIVNESRINDTKKAFIEKLGLEGDELKAFEEEFSDRLEMKSFSIDKLDENLTKAYKLATGYSEEKIKEIHKSKAMASAGSLAGTDRVNDSNKARTKKEVDDLLDGRI